VIICGAFCGFSAATSVYKVCEGWREGTKIICGDITNTTSVNDNDYSHITYSDIAAYKSVNLNLRRLNYLMSSAYAGVGQVDEFYDRLSSVE